ncbi:hypothetical protein C3Z14_10725 [Proteus mirabilis]|uniref:hypothetical protein n=1 Tax=Proteus mirabilis TaxID=584 RepID=UPI000CE077D6|nr:hypothetical protein [Proteus mirabilis]AVA40463.1 hypothetical protein C3Z14_10725 [Proteus mirabilis]EKT9734604.1 hypothetical protein [Proteus mirabilis]EKW6743854.1 hypothetical protein [Proteus mirabilis]ELB1100776.1 hypothetical protein [Proteus mirabilis]QKG49466.1 hypothetical protein HRD56_11595 [Proteus mirabilis]
MFVKILFKKGVLFPKDPIAIQNGQNYYIINCQFCEVYDGKWLVKIDNKVRVRELTRMPMQRIRVSDVGMAFDCELKNLEIIRHVVKRIIDMKNTDFIVNKETINETLKKNEEFLIQNTEKWCAHHATQPSATDYSDPIYQSIYTMRYFPAYYTEYCMLSCCFCLYILKNKVKHLNFISLGCGAATDYYALKDNLINITFNYKGLDINNWDDTLFPNKDNNFSRIQKSILDIDSSDLNDIDAIIFPKSISNLDIDNALVNLADLLNKSGRSSYYILISRENYYYSMSYNKFHNRMIDNGFSLSTICNLKDEVDKTQTYTTTWYFIGESFYEASNNFMTRTISCATKAVSTKQECENCMVVYNPISKIDTNKMGFNFFMYTKEQS